MERVVLEAAPATTANYKYIEDVIGKSLIKSFNNITTHGHYSTYWTKLSTKNTNKKCRGHNEQNVQQNKNITRVVDTMHEFFYKHHEVTWPI